MMTMTKKELALLAGYSVRQLYNINTELPQEKKLFIEADDGKYEAPTFIQRWVEYNINRATGESYDLEQIKAEHEAVKMQKTSLEVDRMRGSLVDVQDVKRLWGDVINTAVQKLIHLPAKVSPTLLMLDNVEVIASIISTEIRTVLQEVSETPLPDYAQSAEPEKDDDDE